MTCFFETFHGNITTIKGFVFVLISNLVCLSCLAYNRNRYWDPEYLAAKYCTLMAIFHLRLTIFSLRCFLPRIYILSKLACLLQLCLLPQNLQEYWNSGNILPCIPLFTTSTFILENTFNNNFAKHLSVFPFWLLHYCSKTITKWKRNKSLRKFTYPNICSKIETKIYKVMPK